MAAMLRTHKVEPDLDVLDIDILDIPDYSFSYRV